MKQIRLFLLVTFVISLPFVVFGCIKKEGEQKPAAQDVKSADATKAEPAGSDEKKEVLYWTCGMHPDIRADKAGNCPICNMKLMPVYKGRSSDEAKEEAYYGCGCTEEATCPVHAGGNKEAQCTCKDHTFMFKGSDALLHNMKCPICGAPLKRLSDEVVTKFKGVTGRVTLAGQEVRRAGVETQPVRKLRIFKDIQTVGKIAYDPDLAIAQEEFIAALRARDKAKEGNEPELIRNSESLVETSRRRLRILGMSRDEVEELERKREIQSNLLLPEEKMWVYADVYEFELPWVKVGDDITVTTTAQPGMKFKGKIRSIDPIIDPKTRSARVRAEIENLELMLKPEMYVEVVIKSMIKGRDGSDEVLVIPKEAVLDTGERKVVWVDTGDGVFEGREVVMGPEATALINGATVKVLPIYQGLLEGDRVVTRANFLIDSQSQIGGAAAAAYGGALGEEEKGKGKAPMPPGHQM